MLNPLKLYITKLDWNKSWKLKIFSNKIGKKIIEILIIKWIKEKLMFYMKYTETFLKVDSLMALYRYPTVQPKLLVFFFL
jgi:hypothetical protein